MPTDWAVSASLVDTRAVAHAVTSPVAIILNDSIDVQCTAYVLGMSLLSIVTCAVPDGKVPACGDAAGGDEYAPIPTTISPDPSPAANRFHTSPKPPGAEKLGKIS